MPSEKQGSRGRQGRVFPWSQHFGLQDFWFLYSGFPDSQPVILGVVSKMLTKAPRAVKPKVLEEENLYDRSAAESSRESEQSLWEALKDSMGFAEDRSFYEEGMRRGGTVIGVRVNDEQINQAAQILSREGAIEQAMPVVEEELQGGQREVGKGTVRVYKRAA